MDAVGLVMGWRVLDHSAHLAGILYGIFWVHMGRFIYSTMGAIKRWNRTLVKAFKMAIDNCAVYTK